MSQLMHP